MTSTAFISSKISDLISKFPFVKCRYEVDAFSNCHYVEVKPKEQYKFNEDYAQYELDFTIEFIAQFPCESITFLTEGDLIAIESPILELSGNWYGRTPVVKTSLTDTIHLTQNSSVKLPKFINEIAKSVYTMNNIPSSHLEEVKFAAFNDLEAGTATFSDSKYAMAA